MISLSSLRPTPVYDSYWHFAAKRQQAYYARLRGGEAPWSDDGILNAYRFTNVFRAADRISQYLIRQVQYGEGRSQEPAEILFRTLLFKIFNKIETWETIERQTGRAAWQSSDLGAIERVLDLAMAQGRRLYSAAYIMPAPGFGRARKHANHLALLERMMLDGLAGQIAGAGSLEEVYRMILAYQGIGPFLAFQYAIDLNYSTIIDFPERDFVVAGPGALDGIAKCFASADAMTAEQIIHLVAERQDEEFNRRGIRFERLFGRPLQPIDCQNLFCEISKYARLAHPDIRGTNDRHRIKQRFDAREATVPPPPFFPPKWRLNVDPTTGRKAFPRQGLLL